MLFRSVALFSILLSILYRHRMTNMAAMTVSMAIGMNIGVTAGIFFGLIYQGDLYHSTLISVLVGILAGATAGLAFGLLTVIEGFMAGMMGGMMGAMLGEMITKLQAVSLLNIFLTITVCSLLLYFILPKQKGTEESGDFNRWLLKPVFTFIALSVYFYYGSQLDKDLASTTKHPSHENHSEMNHGQRDPLVKNITILVRSSVFSYSPNKINLTKNKEVSLTMVNHDSIDHDIVIQKMPISPKTDQSNGTSDNTHGDRKSVV